MAASYLTTEQLSALTGIPAETLRWWRRVNRGPAFIREGATIRYPLTEVEAWKRRRLVVPAGV